MAPLNHQAIAQPDHDRLVNKHVNHRDGVAGFQCSERLLTSEVSATPPRQLNVRVFSCITRRFREDVRTVTSKLSNPS